MAKKKKIKHPKQRDPYILAHIKGEISLSTKSESKKKKKYTRKNKHKGHRGHRDD